MTPSELKYKCAEMNAEPVTLKTTIHYYCFDTRKPEEAQAWEVLQAKLKPLAKRKMHSHSGFPQPITGRNESLPVELETSSLFDNQWNTTDGKRVFDWYQQYRLEGKRIAQGHYLEQTDEMKAIRDNTYECGYCGHKTLHDGFCTKCIGSEYLEEKELYLLRLMPVSFRGKREPLTAEEAGKLLPLYRQAQGLGKQRRGEAVTAKRRKMIAALTPEAQEKARQIIAEAEIKTEAFTWLMDHGYKDLDNVIYYSHTQRFCFGWRKPVEDKSALQDLLKEFPFDYDIK